MAQQPEPLSLLDLSADDIAKLPAALRTKIAAAFGRRNDLSGKWVIVGAGQDWQADLVRGAMRALPRIATERRHAISERNIESLVDILLSGAPRAQVDEDLEFDNAKLRADYLQSTPTLTGAGVRAASGLKPKNKSEPASRWKREGKIFAVRRGGVDLYPSFQFADGVPLPVMKQVLAALPEDLTPWQIALWFASGNGWLDSAAPQATLAAPDNVVDAATRLSEPAVG